MKTHRQGKAGQMGYRLGICAVLCTAAVALTPAGARESAHGASHGQWHSSGAGGHAVGTHGAAAWHGGGVHPVAAQWHGGGGANWSHGWHGGGANWSRGWHGGGGNWYHGWHGGVYGWWWFNAGVWWPYYAWGYPYWWGYSYPYAAYPPPADAPLTYGATPPPQQSWYYCDSPQGYYPQVPTCPGGWHQVPAVPSPQAGGPPGPPPGQ